MFRMAQGLVLVGIFFLAGPALAPQQEPRPTPAATAVIAPAQPGGTSASTPAGPAGNTAPAPIQAATTVPAQPHRPGLPADTHPIKLNPQNLPQMIQAAGYQVQQRTTANGQPFWKASTQVNGWNYQIEILPGFDTQGQIINFWLISELSSPVPTNSLPAGALLKLLDANRTLAPYFFAYSSDTGKLTLNWEHPFHDSNPHEIKQALTHFCKVMRDTEPLWGGNGQPAASNPVPPPAPVIPVVADLTGTTWTGQQDITGPWTPVSFQFQAGGQAIVTVAGKNFFGTWTQAGDQVTMSFPTAANYKGTLNGNTFSGKGQDGVGPWNFNVTKSNS